VLNAPWATVPPRKAHPSAVRYEPEDAAGVTNGVAPQLVPGSTLNGNATPTVSRCVVAFAVRMEPRTIFCPFG